MAAISMSVPGRPIQRTKENAVAETIRRGERLIPFVLNHAYLPSSNQKSYRLQRDRMDEQTFQTKVYAHVGM